MKTTFSIVASLFIALPAWLNAATFSIDNIRLHEQGSISSEGIKSRDIKTYVPQVEVDVRVSEDAQSQNLIAKAYFFDGSGKLIQVFKRPSIAQHLLQNGVVRNNTYFYIWPIIVPANSKQELFFPLPQKLPDTWSLVVVFGNTNGAVASAVPEGQEHLADYPEKDLVAKTLLSPDVPLTDPAPSAPLIEEKVVSDNPLYPAFTLLMHLPHGVTNPKDVRGVLAMCMMANSVQEIRDRLNAIQASDDPNPYFAFAESHKLAIVAWGARWVWNSYANFDELNQDQIHAWDDNFQKLADAWDRGVDLLVHNYGIPDHDYLMYGLCAGGEWVHRLALHKPKRFLAVQMHISSSYDAPTPEANHLMWLLTTGELDSGCDRARRFYETARAMHYPIIFKAVMGIGHSDSPIADQLGIRFFEYALAQKARRDAANAAEITAAKQLDLSGFNLSPFYGDLMNQNMFTAGNKEMIPAGFLVPLPNKDIADAWNQ